MQDSERDTDVKNSLLDSVGEGQGGMTWENSIETCILSYVRQMTSSSLMHEAGHSKPVLWDNPEGWGGEGGGKGFKMGDHTWEKKINAYFNVKEKYDGHLTQRHMGPRFVFVLRASYTWRYLD